MKSSVACNQQESIRFTQVSISLLGVCHCSITFPKHQSKGGSWYPQTCSNGLDCTGKFTVAELLPFMLLKLRGFTTKKRLISKLCSRLMLYLKQHAGLWTTAISCEGNYWKNLLYRKTLHNYTFWLHSPGMMIKTFNGTTINIICKFIKPCITSKGFNNFKQKQQPCLHSFREQIMALLIH